MQIFDGMATVLESNNEAFGFAFSTMRELADKASMFITEENVKMSVQFDCTKQQKSQENATCLSEATTQDLVLELLRRKGVEMPISYPVTVLFVNDIDPLGEGPSEASVAEEGNVGDGAE